MKINFNALQSDIACNLSESQSALNGYMSRNLNDRVFVFQEVELCSRDRVKGPKS